MSVTKIEKKLLHALREYIEEASKPVEEKEKKPKSAWLFFCDEKRMEVVAEMLRENPNSTIRSTDVLKKIGMLWKETCDEDKKKYHTMVEKEKQHRIVEEEKKQ